MTHTHKQARIHTGFTLVEVLIAVAILIIGVIAALRIFPAGFSAYDKSQYAHTALKLAKQQINGFLENPDSLPDAILPVEENGADPDFRFDDLNMMDVRLLADNWDSGGVAYIADQYVINNNTLYKCTANHTSAPGNEPGTGGGVGVWDGAGGSAVLGNFPWYAKHAYPLSATNAVWPLWQPRSARVLRQIIGEKVQVPSELSDEELTTVAIDSGGVSTSTVTVNDASNIKKDMVLRIGGTAVTVTANPVGNNITVNPSIPVTVNASVFTAIAFVPKYLPTFGPIMRKGYVDPRNKNFISTGDPVTMYDVRYQRVANPTTDFTYTMTRNQAAGEDTIKLHVPLLANNVPRALRVTFFCHDPVNNDIVQIKPTVWTLPQAGGPGGDTLYPQYDIPLDAATNTKGIFTFDSSTCTIKIKYEKSGLPNTAWRILDGSEQINRAYIYVPPTAAGSTEDDPYERYNLPTGHFTVNRDTSGETANILGGSIFFSPKDAGKKVKIDYIAADWNILHDDVTVGGDGYISLALPGMKAAWKPRFPREQNTWGLYKPMARQNTESLIASAVELRSGQLYYIYARPKTVQYTWTASPSGYSLNDFVMYNDVMYRCIQGHSPSNAANNPPNTAFWEEAREYRIELQGNSITQTDRIEIDPDRGRIRFGLYDTGNNNIDWAALRGSTFRVFYRAKSDWTVQVFRAPAMFWYVSNGAPGWQSFSRNAYTGGGLPALPGTDQTVHRVYSGHTLAVDYQYYQETAKVVSVDSSGSNLTVDNPQAIRDMSATTVTYYVANPPATPGQDVTPFTITVVPPAPGSDVVAAGGIPGVKPGALLLPYDNALPDVISPIAQRNGELHTVSADGVIRLQHVPARTTPIYVRGQSVTVRAAWTQNRPGQVYTYANPQPNNLTKDSNERWASKSLTVTMPTVKE